VRLVRYWYDYDAQQGPAEWCIYRQSDENGDGTLDIADPVTVVARNIVNGSTEAAIGGPLPVFEYFDPYSEAALSEPVSPGEVARVRIRLVADPDPADSPTQFDLVSMVTPRN